MYLAPSGARVCSPLTLLSVSLFCWLFCRKKRRKAQYRALQSDRNGFIGEKFQRLEEERCMGIDLSVELVERSPQVAIFWLGAWPSESCVLLERIEALQSRALCRSNLIGQSVELLQERGRVCMKRIWKVTLLVNGRK